MPNAQPLVMQLQADAIDASVSTSSLLRKAKIVATKLDLPEFLEWIDKELNGYDGATVEEMPSYRMLKGIPEGLNPYRGWGPILFENTKQHEQFSIAPIAAAIGPTEQMLSESKNRMYEFQYPPEMKLELLQAITRALPLNDAHIKLNYGQVWGIVDAVRNIILDWSLELEKSGVLGEGLTFSENEKREAAPVSHQFFAYNIGVVGNVGDQAHVTTMQSVNVQQLDHDKLADLVQQIKMAAPIMPEDKQCALVKEAAELEQELGKEHLDPSKLRRALTSIKTICEGAAGNVAAQGILALIGGIL